MEARRNTQLDGWRAFAVAGVMWLHWSPREWHSWFPFEIGLFYFLTLTGYLITRILLQTRASGGAPGVRWRARAMKDFLKRRFTRILVPCYAAMLFALLVGAPDIRQHPLVYALHLSNWHIAFLQDWPSGTSHYWTLAIQMQFYLFWPLVVWFIPWRLLAPVFFLMVLIAPVSRHLACVYFPQVVHPEAVTFSALDYFGVGALLALALHHGMRPGDRRLAWLSTAAFAAYTVLYVGNEADTNLAMFGYFQQTLLAVAFAGLISATLRGFHGPLGRVLDHPVVQAVAGRSYALYLLHTAVPLLVGLIIPWLWHPSWLDRLLVPRLLVFTLCSWWLAGLCWRWLEGPRRLRWTGLLRNPESDRNSAR